MTEEMTNCELCSKEIPINEVRHCTACDQDGMCDECYHSHDNTAQCPSDTRR